jgi:antitoxin ParD1/3/4
MIEKPEALAETVDTTPSGESCDLRLRAEFAFNVAQAKALKEVAAKGGLSFEAWLPPQQALWLLGLVESGKYADPHEALFNLLGEAQDLSPHEDLRKELLKRSLEAALMPGDAIPIEDSVPGVREQIIGAQPEPAVWQDWPGSSEADADNSG